MAYRGEARRGEQHETARGGPPRVRRDLERERVATVQRERLLGAMVQLSREYGPERVTVAHVVTRAGVSRRTFYELFSDREDCFQAALEQALERAATVVVAAYRGEQGWCERIRAALTALLEFFDAEPATAALCVVDALGAGPRALRRRGEVVEKLVDVVDRGRREARTRPAATGTRSAQAVADGACPGEVAEARSAGPAATSRLAAEGVVGAVLAILHARLGAGSPKSLMSLRGQLMSLIVLPYLGPTAAQAELTRRAPRVRRAKRAHEDPLRGLSMRLTYRTMRVLAAIGAGRGISNRHVAREAGIADQGQISKLLARLQGLGLIDNTGAGVTKGEPNAWVLTPRGAELERAIRTRAER